MKSGALLRHFSLPNISPEMKAHNRSQSTYSNMESIPDSLMLVEYVVDEKDTTIISLAGLLAKYDATITSVLSQHTYNRDALTIQEVQLILLSEGTQTEVWNTVVTME
ncbi:hypothetical protein TorRG33x02_320980, partial [Trema orientale]